MSMNDETERAMVADFARAKRRKENLHHVKLHLEQRYGVTQWDVERAWKKHRDVENKRGDSVMLIIHIVLGALILGCAVYMGNIAGDEQARLSEYCNKKGVTCRPTF